MMDAKKSTPRHIIIKMPKVKDKKKILEAESYLQRNSRKTVRKFLKRNFAGQKELAKNIQSHEKQGPTAKIALFSKAITEN